MGGSNDLTISINTAFGADNADLRKALGTISVDAEKMADSFASAGASASRAFDTIGLGAQNQVSRLQRFHDGFQQLTGNIGKGLGAIDEFAKALGPWNQALELGGKALKFLGEGMDAYAKTSPEARREVEALKSEFGKLKDSAMAAVGEITVGVLKPIPNLKQLEEQMKAVGRAGGDMKKAAEESSKAWGFISNIASGKALGMITGSADPWDTGMTAGEARDKAIAWFNAQKQAQQAAAKKAAGTDKAGKQLGWSPPPPSTTTTFEDPTQRTQSFTQIGGVTVGSAFNPDLSIGAAAGMNGVDEGQLAMMASQQAIAKSLTLDWFAEVNKREGQQSWLEATFGSVDDFSAYSTAFGTLQTATTSAMQAWISGSMSLGAAIKKGIGDALGALASQLAVEALKHGAYALGSLAFGDFSGAARHGAAAAAFGAGAAAAAVAAKKLGGSGAAAATASKGGGSAGAGASSGGGGGGGGGSGGGQRSMIIVYGDSFANDSPRMQQVRAEQLVKKATGSSAAVHS